MRGYITEDCKALHSTDVELQEQNWSNRKQCLERARGWSDFGEQDRDSEHSYTDRLIIGYTECCCLSIYTLAEICLFTSTVPGGARLRTIASGRCHTPIF